MGSKAMSEYQVGSENHNEKWKQDGGEVRAAENDMIAKTQSMQSDIMEKMVLGMAGQLEAQVDAQLEAAENEMSDLDALRTKRLRMRRNSLLVRNSLSGWCATSIGMPRGDARSWTNISRRWLQSASKHGSSRSMLKSAPSWWSA